MRPEQFQRIRMMLGDESLARLHRSRVIVAGLGAVGSFALEALARAGVGQFLLIDCDQIQASNINRQLFALWDTVGRAKTEVARERLLLINPDLKIETKEILLNSETIRPLLMQEETNHPDLLIDAIDSLAPKVELISESLQRGIPLLSSMGAALRMDPDRVRFGPLTEVTHCRLSAMLRKRLRRRGLNTDLVPCVYSDEEIRNGREADLLSRYGGKILPPEETDESTRPHGRIRSTLGSLSTLTGIFGLRIAHEAIRRLTTK